MTEEVTLCGLFQRTIAADPDAVAIRAHGETGFITRREYGEAVERIAGALAGLGVRRGDTVGLMMSNRPEFHLIDTAVLHLGATPFSIYNTSAPQQISYLLNHAENRVMLCEQQYVETIRAAEGLNHLEHIVVVDAEGGLPAGTTSLGRLSTPDDFDFESTWRAVLPEDILTLIYTSGTTGPPKGVELTHANVMFVLQACNNRFPFVAEGRCISYLPTAHMADRIFSHYLQMATGWTITTVQDARQIFSAVAQTHPSWFMGVPRIWEKLRASLLARFKAQSASNQSAIDAAIDVAVMKLRIEEAGGELNPEMAEQWKLADAEILAPLRKELGLDQADLLMTGAAPIAPIVHEFFLALGLPLAEGYGMSETGALGMTNLPGDIRMGTVGQPMPGTLASLAEDGELLLKGAHVMRGYRKDPEKTKEAVDEDGWLHTGDVATIDAEGFVRIIDRKKELIINAAGKNMSPVNIESTLKGASPLIGQVCCVGDARPYNVALIVLDPDVALAFVRQHKRPVATAVELTADEHIRKAVADAVDTANRQLSRVEQIKRYRLLASEWLPDGDELTPTSKLKRRAIAAKYADVIEAMYPAE
ncbi:AMP-dependent synthetase [Mycolicibacterium peregrinum]|uniref:Acyl-CoA synthetase n=1 Tax=Mycolicibacterium peregrinum TaxID=43304 RepID=A0A1A0QYM4_MYCPR|nr:long-chain fatty acid--CoA ligase [Mycolicibacterium peregrinum]OBB27177.1 AMP-dependent synthetase [Mycolicibacterium peregrinum]